MKAEWLIRPDDLLFPPYCPSCGTLFPPRRLGDGRSALCSECEAMWRREYNRTLHINTVAENPDTDVFCLAEYEPGRDSAARRIILSAKDDPSGARFDFIARELYTMIKQEAFFGSETAWLLQSGCTIVPVPRSPRTYRERGFDQSVLTARRLAWYFNGGKHPGTRLAEVRTLIGRRDFREEQKELDFASRHANAEKVFFVKHPGSISGTVLLVDDIMTTGASIAVCAGLMRDMGARKVVAAVIGIGRANRKLRAQLSERRRRRLNRLRGKRYRVLHQP